MDQARSSCSRASLLRLNWNNLTAKLRITVAVARSCSVLRSAGNDRHSSICCFTQSSMSKVSSSDASHTRSWKIFWPSLLATCRSISECFQQAGPCRLVIIELRQRASKNSQRLGE